MAEQTKESAYAHEGTGGSACPSCGSSCRHEPCCNCGASIHD